MVNGKKHDFEDLKLYFNGVQLMDLQDINYSDEQEWELLYGSGSRPNGMGRGLYRASGDITLSREDFDTINNACKVAGKTPFDLKPFMVIASYGAKISGDDLFIETQNSPLHTDTLVNCVVTKRDFGIKQGDKGNTVKMEILFEKII